jgi:hypothetical protein
MSLESKVRQLQDRYNSDVHYLEEKRQKLHKDFDVMCEKYQVCKQEIQ